MALANLWARANALQKVAFNGSLSKCGNVGLARSRQTVRFGFLCPNLPGPKQLQVRASFLAVSLVMMKTVLAEGEDHQRRTITEMSVPKPNAMVNKATSRSEREANAAMGDPYVDSGSTPQRFGPRPASPAVSVH
jgi:hypothetical protein